MGKALADEPQSLNGTKVSVVDHSAVTRIAEPALTKFDPNGANYTSMLKEVENKKMLQ
jgi:fructose-specific component phosphotransferase system IIB-like protein